MTPFTTTESVQAGLPMLAEIARKVAVTISPKPTLELVIETSGTVGCLYSDALGVRELGEALGAEPKIRRASHVEPTQDGRWTADMSPVGGAVLGPFNTRAEALSAEIAWIDREIFGGCAPGEECGP